MKQNNRIRRNGGRKASAVQSPKTPESRPGKSRVPHQGMIEIYDSRLETGFVAISPKLAAKLKQRGTLIFAASDLVGEGAQSLKPGDKVSFHIGKDKPVP